MKPRPRTEPSVAEPPMTPMIDVVFLLLIFFLLTMKFTDLEGKLVTHLPRDKGPNSGPAPVPEEVRIYLCAETSPSGIRCHREDKGRHDSPQNPRLDGAEVEIHVERRLMGLARRDPDVPPHALYDSTARTAARMRSALALDLDPAPILIDADSEVPFDHVIGILNALKRHGIHHVEFTANPRLNRTFSP